jgi:hypothetical protein
MPGFSPIHEQNPNMDDSPSPDEVKVQPVFETEIEPGISIGPKRGGPPKGYGTQCTPEVTAAICAILEDAVPVHYALSATGIRQQAYNTWLSHGKNGVEPYVAFYEAIERAKGIAVVKMHKIALEGGKGAGSALWFLERRYYKEYGQRQKIEHSHQDDRRNLSPEELEEEIARSQNKLDAYEQIRRAQNGFAEPDSST